MDHYKRMIDKVLSENATLIDSTEQQRQHLQSARVPGQAEENKQNATMTTVAKTEFEMDLTIATNTNTKTTNAAGTEYYDEEDEMEVSGDEDDE